MDALEWQSGTSETRHVATLGYGEAAEDTKFLGCISPRASRHDLVFFTKSGRFVKLIKYVASL